MLHPVIHETTASERPLIILDYGSQYTRLIARRVRELEVYSEIVPHTVTAEMLRERDPIGIVLSGGPRSVDEPDAPGIDADILALGVPVLGICYGMQLIARLCGGRVARGESGKYGRTEVRLTRDAGPLFHDLARRQTVWASHGDHVDEAPPGFVVTAKASRVPVIAMMSPERRLYGIQFHPEVAHTPEGAAMLGNFLRHVCEAPGGWRMERFAERAVEIIRAQVGPEGRVLCALSGGVDSSVMGALMAQALGHRLQPVFVDNGLLRKGERDQVMTDLRQELRLPIQLVDAREVFLDALRGVEDPELKRRIIGHLFIEVFERSVADLDDIAFLAQGTLYPDVIESAVAGGPAVTIKTHHNVGGLPERLGFALVEPLRMLFKDEVRRLGRALELPESLLMRHPFPGPGLAVRVLGEVTEPRLAVLREADAIFIEELRESGWYDRTSQAFAVFLPVKAVGVMGDGRTYDNVIALRAVETTDFMTADWSPLPYALLGHVANRIVNEVDGVNRVVYDVTSKPPGTIEWE
ncbi:MAG: glutamine-hydrolyzing GMP synthase [Acidobacteriota bacterium]